MRRLIRIIVLSTLACIFCPGTGKAQNPGMHLQSLFTRLMATRVDSSRLLINDSIDLIINEYVRSDSIFEHNFREIRNLGQITAPGGELKIVTWNLVLSDTGGFYFCYFIVKSGKQNKIFKLTSPYKNAPLRTNKGYSEKDWYGALYYDAMPMTKENKGNYMLLGIDYGNPLVTRKIIDVVSFPPEGGVVFGKNWFISGKELKFREVIEYSPEAVASLRFLSEKMIVFDHLVPLNPALSGKREFYAPDFSYDAYEFEKGTWNFKLNVDVRNPKK